MTHTSCASLLSRRTCRSLAVCYVGVVAVGAAAYAAAGSPESWGAALHLAAFPGGALVALAALVAEYLLASLGAWTPDPAFEGGAPGPFSALTQFAGGAVVNVLLAWGAITFVRHFLREARRSRSRR